MKILLDQRHVFRIPRRNNLGRMWARKVAHQMSADEERIIDFTGIGLVSEKNLVLNFYRKQIWMKFL